MGAAQSASVPSHNVSAVSSESVCEVNPLNPKGLKPCCACPETKSARDTCFLKNDPAIADEKCKELVQRHIACMRGYGFKV